MLHTIFYFILALLLLITIHEFGHFIVARLCGVKVLRFSFGFGKVLTSWTDKRGTEYAWSLFPLGGYVKMLDETEGNVPEELRHKAFNNKSVWARMAIVLAGPFFNFLFAFMALWLMWMIGIKSLAPIIDDVKPGSIMARAGVAGNQEIIALDNKPINSWRDFQYALMPLLGSEYDVPMTVRSLKNHQTNHMLLPLGNWKIDPKSNDALDSLGIIPFVPKIPPIIGSIAENSPAKTADLQKGDRFLSVDSKPISDWLDLVNYVHERPNQSITLEVDRKGVVKKHYLTTGSIIKDGESQGFLGVISQKVDWPKHWLRQQSEKPAAAAEKAFHQTVQLTATTFTLMGRLLIGKLPVQSLSGPVGIAQGAGQSARGGLAYYLSFLALVSISLGALNLLPIPVLDGGHFLYYVIEVIRRKPLSDEVKSTGAYLGIVLLMTLMVIALTNDISRLAG